MEIKKLTELEKVSTPNWVVAVIFLLPSLFLSGLKFWTGEFWAVFIFIALIYWGMNIRAIVAIPFVKKNSQRVMEASRSSLINFIGRNPKYLDVSFDVKPDGIGGSAIAYDQGYVYLMQRGIAAKVPWGKIRSWKWEVPGYSQIIDLGNPMSSESVVTGIRLNAKNQEAFAKAFKNSGFFVEISDIENPSWQFTSNDVNVLKKWFEIFNQLNENDGELSA